MRDRSEILAGWKRDGKGMEKGWKLSRRGKTLKNTNFAISRAGMKRVRSRDVGGIEAGYSRDRRGMVRV
jgi:hypothetical protein